MMWTRLTTSKKSKNKRGLILSQEISTFLFVVSLWVSCLCITCLVVFVLPWPPSEDCRYIMKTAKVRQLLEMCGRTMWQEDSWVDELYTQREQTRLAWLKHVLIHNVKKSVVTFNMKMIRVMLIQIYEWWACDFSTMSLTRAENLFSVRGRCLKNCKIESVAWAW